MKHTIFIAIFLLLGACAGMPSLPITAEEGARKVNEGFNIYFTAKYQKQAYERPKTECGEEISRNEWRDIGSTALDTLAKSLDVDVLQTCDAFGHQSTF
ncbi:MAG: hypothetical protein AAF512_00725 [Pseudomonadota bacterium]